MAKRKNKHIGSSFDDFLAEEGLLEGANAVALKRVIAWQIEHARKERGMSKAELAQRMDTSRSALDRLLSQDEPSVTLDTLGRAIQALDAKLKIELKLAKAA
jgi:DNA-binding Xre family transcriptional regulator